MGSLVIIILSLMLMLGVACLLLPLASRYSIPYTVLLAVFGMIIGVFSSMEIREVLPVPLADFLAGIQASGLNGQVLIYIFLPGLLFSAGLGVDVRRLMDDSAHVLIMAVVAVVLCTFVVAYSLNLTFGVSIAVAALLGSIIATTDPVAVLAIFRDIGVPRRLQILVEGESLFNDAAAVALFTMFLSMVSGQQENGWLDDLIRMTVGFIGGLGFGYLVARLGCSVLRLVSNYYVAEVTLTLCLAYAIYIVADLYLGLSGVAATVAAALVIGTIGRTHVSAEGWVRMHALWNQIDFIASTLIFVLAATTIPQLISDLSVLHVGMLAVVVFAAFLARAIALYAIMPLLSAVRLAHRVSTKHKTVILWGGLRGAFTLAIALSVLENPLVPEDTSKLVAELATGFVLFTLFINAPTLQPMIKLLGLNKLTMLEALLRQRTMVISGESVRKSLLPIARDFGVNRESDREEKIVKPLLRDTDTIDHKEALIIGLITVASQEEKLYLKGHEDRTISNRIIGFCMAHAGRLKDAAKTGGLDAYLQVSYATIRINTTLKLVLMINNRLGFSRPLARVLGYRFEALLIRRSVIKRLRNFNEQSVAPMLGEEVSRSIDEALAMRLSALDSAIQAFESQYPGYATILRTSYVERAALRLEEAEYIQKREDGIISPEVYRSLNDDMQRRREKLGSQPLLDMGLKVTEMIRAVPLFEGMTDPQLQFVASMLRPRLAIPGEVIINRGEIGEEMFFITSGSVEINDPSLSHPIIREEGGFFGEVALLFDTSRIAEVKSRGYCHLLVLYSVDLKRLMRRYPETREAIERAARARMNHEITD